jgi:hypothetical protein
MPFWEEGAVINASYNLTKRSWKKGYDWQNYAEYQTII